MLLITAFLILTFSAQHGVAVTNCGIGTDPFFQTVSYNSKYDMWRADSIVVEHDLSNDQVHTYTQQHWETRTINSQCIITRTVYMIMIDAVYIYQQKIFPAVEGRYQLQEYNPFTDRFEVVDINARRIDSKTVSMLNEWVIDRQLKVDVPHQSYYETVEAHLSLTSVTCTVVLESQQNELVKLARDAYEHGADMPASAHPFPSLVFRV